MGRPPFKVFLLCCYCFKYFEASICQRKYSLLSHQVIQKSNVIPVSFVLCLFYLLGINISSMQIKTFDKEEIVYPEKVQPEAKQLHIRRFIFSDPVCHSAPAHCSDPGLFSYTPYTPDSS